MKHICLVTIAIIALSASARATSTVQPDTIILRLDNGQEVKIISEDNNEVEVLNNYDVNAIIDDLRESMDSVNSEAKAIELEDSTGTKYFGKRETSSDESLARRVEQLADKVKWLSISLGEEDDPQDGEEHSSSDHKPPRRTNNMLSFDLGFNNYLNQGDFPDDNNAPYAVKPFVSWYIALGTVNRTKVTGPLYLDWGANVSWYNFKFENERTRLEKTDAEVRFFEATDVPEPIKSKLVVPYLNVSFVPMLQFGEPLPTSIKEGDVEVSMADRSARSGFRIGAGVYAGYRLGSRAKYVFREDDDRKRVKDRTNFYVNNWRYGVRVQAGFRGVDVFANYDLNELFVDGRGPELNAFSFGIVF